MIPAVVMPISFELPASLIRKSQEIMLPFIVHPAHAKMLYTQIS